MYQKNNTLSARVFNSSNFRASVKDEYYQEDSYSCGYYVAKAIIDSLGKGETRTLKWRMKITRDSGTSETRLVKTLRKAGVSCCVYRNLDNSSIKRHLSKGKYIIVYHHSADHWMVLYDLSKFGNYKIYDPEGVISTVSVFWAKGILKSYGIVCSRH